MHYKKKLILFNLINIHKNLALDLIVTRFEGQGRKDEEVRGDEPQKGCLITQNKTVTSKRKQKLRRSSSLVVWSSAAVGLSLSRCSLLPLTAGRREPFQVSPAITGIRYRC